MGFQGLGVGVEDLRCVVGFGVQRYAEAKMKVGWRVQGAGCRVQGAGCKVHGAWCRVAGFMVQASGVGVGRAWTLNAKFRTSVLPIRIPQTPNTSPKHEHQARTPNTNPKTEPQTPYTPIRHSAPVSSIGGTSTIIRSCDQVLSGSPKPHTRTPNMGLGVPGHWTRS